MIRSIVRDREVAVIGLGASGLAAVRLLVAEGCSVYASDAGASPALEASAALVRSDRVSVDLGRHDQDRICRAALVVVSPGVAPDAAPIAAARAAGRTIWAEAELGLRALAGQVPYVAVTGTNGKTTTTALVGHLFEAGRRSVVTAGNIGTPLCEVVRGDLLPEVIALELSSFQLHDMPSVQPAVGVLTNLAPDHLDRYPRLADYYEDKRRLFANATPESIWVSNADDPTSLELVEDVAGRHLRFSLTGPADGWLDRGAGVLRLGETAILLRTRLPLLGDHNVANALAASLAVRALGVATEFIARGLETVSALPHRLEPVGERGEVLWINDSKATNVSSTEVAVAAMDRPFILLLGGRHKGEPYTKLAPRLAGRCRAVVAYGEAEPRIAADLGGAVRVEGGGSFAEVLERARTLARPGDAVLLSPACSSYDMFTNYLERGDRFRAYVEGL